MNKKRNCLNCVYAEWKKRKNGTLHPSGDGFCKYEIRLPNLPKCFYWVAIPIVGHGYINRHNQKIDCPCWKEKK